MRRALAAVVVMGMLGGCTYRQARKAAITGGLITVAGVGVTAAGIASFEHARDFPLIAVVAGIYLLVVPGAAIGAGGLLGMAVHHGDRERDRERERAAAHDRALEITEQAQVDARAGNCAAVAAHEREVGARAPSVHAAVFRRDVAITRCLDAEHARVTSEREECLARRSETLRAAQAVEDAHRRQEMLRAAPRCAGERP